MELTVLEEKIVSMLRQDPEYATQLMVELAELGISQSVLLCDRCEGLTRHECFTWAGEEEETCHCVECHKENNN